MKHAVCLLVLNWSNQILSVTRKGTEDSWCLPGGKVDPGETLIQALVREVREETGVQVNPDYCFFCYAAVSAGDTDFYTNIYRYYMPESFAKESLVPEVGSKVSFIPVSKLLEGPFREFYKNMFPTIKEFIS